MVSMDIRFEVYLEALREHITQMLGGEVTCRVSRNETTELIFDNPAGGGSKRFCIDRYYAKNIQIEAAAGDIVSRLQESVEKAVSYEDIKERIGIQLSGRHKSNILEKSFLDLKITFYVFGDAGNPISNSLFASWNISLGDLYRQALLNEYRKCSHVIQRMNNFLQGQTRDVEKADSTDLWLMVTNKQYCMGASVILRSEVLEELQELYNGDFLILPYSVHNVITIPYDIAGYGGREQLNATMKGFYENSAAQDAGLTDNIYRYDSLTKKIKRFI